MATTPNIADHSAYSRKRLGEAVYGEEYATRCEMLRQGSTALLRAIERARAEPRL